MSFRQRLPVESEEMTLQLSRVWESIDSAVTIVTPDGRITYANPACATLYGYTIDEFRGLAVDELISTEDEDEADGVGALPNPPTPNWEGEVVGVRQDGRRFYVHLTRGPVHDDEGHPVGHAIVHRDITDEMQTRDLLVISAETQIKGANESAAIVKLGWIANSSLNVSEVYDQIASELGRLIDYDRLAILGVNDDQTSGTVLYVSGVEVPDSVVGVTNSLSEEAHSLIRSRSASMHGDASESEFGSEDAAHAAGLHSMIAVPLIANNSVVAILVLRSKRKDAYTNQDLGMARRAGMQLAGAIANSQLYDIARHEAEQRRGLAELGRIVSSSPRIEDVYDQFAEKVAALIPYDRLTISLIGAQLGFGVCAYASGTDIPEMRPGAVNLPTPVTDRVIDQRAGVMTHDVDEPTADRPSSFPIASVAGLRSFLTAPLISLNEVVGIFQINSMSLEVYTENDLTLAERIAGQISGPIANSKLYAEHLAMEGALRDSEDRYRMLVENANDAIVVIRDDVIVYSNEAWQRMLGHDLEAPTVSSFFDDVVREDRDRVHEYHRDLLRGIGAPDEYEMRVLTRTGSEMILEAKPRVVKFEDRNSVMVVMRDATERKRLQEQLFQVQKMDAVGQLAGGVAHDFNNLLSVILGFSELAHMNLPEDGGRLGEQLDEIQEAAQRGARLTRQLLTFSRSQVIEPQVLDVNRLVEDLDNMLGRLVKEDIEMVIEPYFEPCMVNADPGQLEQV